jgi:hypothetical protein
MGIEVHDGSVEIHENNVFGHAVGARAFGTDAVDARDNGWGCPDGPDAGECDDVGSSIVYDPWLTAPNPDAGPG